MWAREVTFINVNIQNLEINEFVNVKIREYCFNSSTVLTVLIYSPGNADYWYVINLGFHLILITLYLQANFRIKNYNFTLPGFSISEMQF